MAKSSLITIFDLEEKQKACTDKLPQQNKTTGSTEETTEVSETVSIDLPHPGHSKEEENELQEEVYWLNLNFYYAV